MRRCPATVARQFKSSWNPGLSGSGVRGTAEWMQSLKDNFLQLTRFTSDDPGKRKRQWREDLTAAADQTVLEMCPDWATNLRDRAIFDLIEKTKQRKKSPRQEWLREKAYAWLKWLPPELQQQDWYPGHAIQVAHHLFLSGSGKFDVFLKHLRQRNNLKIIFLIRSHEGMLAGKPGSF